MPLPSGRRREMAENVAAGPAAVHHGHVAEADLVDKGLAHDSVGLLASIALGSRAWRPPTR
jgi:hypothetical protein